MAVSKRRIWQSVNWHRAYFRLSPAQREKILKTQSLTKSVKRLCHQKNRPFRLRIDYQGLSKLRIDEAQFLGLKPGRFVFAREVSLLCGDECQIQARSLMKLGEHNYPFSPMHKAGNRPLGEILFNRNRLQRSDFKIRYTRQTKTWSRRSSFHWKTHNLYLEEVFINTLF
jgi:chorismate--pyruvate lyase